MIDYLNHLDRTVICYLADEFHNSFLDVVLPFMRQMKNWIPVYIAAGSWMVFRFKKVGLLWLLALILVVAATDLTGNYLFKKNFQRVRPCNVPELAGELKVLVNCGSGYSFISNHAANHFAMATFVVISLTRRYKRWSYLLYGWAGLVAFAQVYVGVHYLSDIAVGALVGSLIANFAGRYLIRLFHIKF